MEGYESDESADSVYEVDPTQTVVLEKNSLR